ncbi:MAG: hypothetical protein KatS3mg001_117 [Candidatus Pacearchaeota archaeon]|nr:MAG: hypothetical protein KatS3mg001_117 [Candidatus Pacearchaeota archaeon]
MKRASFKEKFLLSLVKELIKNTKSYKRTFIEIEVKKFLSQYEEYEKEKTKEEAKKKDEGISSLVREKMQEEKERVIELKKEEKPLRLLFEKSVPKIKIPELILPETFQYLKPIPLNLPYEINLKKLDPLIKDPFVKTIECPGPNSEIVVEGKFGRKRTQIKLTKEEIDEILQIFSSLTKIPLIEGLYKVVFGNLELSALISEKTRFRIRKLSFIGQTFSPKPIKR